MEKKRLIIGVVVVVLALGMISSAMSNCSGEGTDSAGEPSSQQAVEQQAEPAPDFSDYVGMNAFAVGKAVQAKGWSMEFTDTAAKAVDYRNQTQYILDDLAQSESEADSMVAVHYVVAGVMKVDESTKTVSFEVLSKTNAEAKGIVLK